MISIYPPDVAVIIALFVFGGGYLVYTVLPHFDYEEGIYYRVPFLLKGIRVALITVVLIMGFLRASDFDFSLFKWVYASLGFSLAGLWYIHVRIVVSILIKEMDRQRIPPSDRRYQRIMKKIRISKWQPVFLLLCGIIYCVVMVLAQ